MHADRTNRIMLLALALVLIGAGLDAGAASTGAFGTATRHSPLTANPTGNYIGAQGDWLWPAAAAAAVIITLLALRWLLTLLFSTDRTSTLLIHPGTPPGRTTLHPKALTQAVTEEIEGYPGVSTARARLLGDPENPQLTVTAALEETTNFAALRQRIETGALTHARTAVGDPALPIQLNLTVTTKPPTRVT